MYLDRAAISTAKGPIAAELRLSDESMGLVFGAFALGYALAQIPSGWLADRYGPRVALTAVVSGWSVLTALTGAAQGLWSLIGIRFAFGVAEAGAFPGAARVYYNWLPAAVHGRANALTFAASRMGAALAFPLLNWMLSMAGWRKSFYLLAIPGIIWAVVWILWFRDHPVDYHPPAEEREQVLWRLVFSAPMLLAMAQYFASNFTFFLCLSWMNPYLVEHYKMPPGTAAWCLTGILLIGATAQGAAGSLVDWLHKRGLAEWSRRGPAICGFAISAAALGLLTQAESSVAAVALFTAATFGAEMTISPSWAYCIDLGGKKSGAISGSMNMVGNLGSFVSASIFPVLYRLSHGATLYFLVAALMNAAAVLVWWKMRSIPRDTDMPEARTSGT